MSCILVVHQASTWTFLIMTFVRPDVQTAFWFSWDLTSIHHFLMKSHEFVMKSHEFSITSHEKLMRSHNFSWCLVLMRSHESLVRSHEFSWSPHENLMGSQKILVKFSWNLITESLIRCHEILMRFHKFSWTSHEISRDLMRNSWAIFVRDAVSQIKRRELSYRKNCIYSGLQTSKCAKLDFLKATRTKKSHYSEIEIHCDYLSCNCLVCVLIFDKVVTSIN